MITILWLLFNNDDEYLSDLHFAVVSIFIFLFDLLTFSLGMAAYKYLMS